MYVLVFTVMSNNNNKQETTDNNSDNSIRSPNIVYHHHSYRLSSFFPFPEYFSCADTHFLKWGGCDSNICILALLRCYLAGMNSFPLLPHRMRSCLAQGSHCNSLC